MRSSRPKAQFGVMFSPEYTDLRELLKLWRMAEELGFDSAWADDHFVPRTVDGPKNESWTTLTYLLSQTERLRGGPYVSGVTYRNPAILAKMAANVDIISNGRLIFTIGGAWHKVEHDAYGVTFPPAVERLRRLDEACEVITKLWSLKPGERANFQGKYYSLKDAPFSPLPVQKPHPPIMVGGGGEKMTLRVVAKWADWWNVQEQTLPAVQRKMEALRQHCKAVGRNYDDIKKTIGIPLIMTPDRERGRAMAERIAQRRNISVEDAATTCFVGTVDDMKELTQRYIDIGITYFVLPLLPPFRLDDVRRFAEEVMPAFS